MAHLHNRRQGLGGRNVFQKEVCRIWKKQKVITLGIVKVTLKWKAETGKTVISQILLVDCVPARHKHLTWRHHHQK